MTISLMLPLVGKTQADLKRVDKGTGSLTFTRATTATRVNPDTGLIESVASGDLREDGRQYKNIFSYSEQFENAVWSVGGVSVVADATIAPNGKMVADKIIEDLSASTAHRLQRVDVSISSGIQYTYSHYFKKGAGRDWVYLRLFDGTTTKYAWFNLATGVKGTCDSGATSLISASTGGWYRCSITWTAASTGGPGAVFGIASADNVYSYTGDGASYIYSWGAQLELSSSMGRYVRSGSSPAYSPKGVLIEGQRTNLCVYSEDRSDVSWSKNDVTVSADSTTAPDGTSAADKIVETATTNLHYISRDITVSNVEHAHSVYAKAGGRNRIRLNVSTNYAVFNLATGVVVSGSGVIEPIGSGWYRCSVADLPFSGTTLFAYVTLQEDDGTENYAGDITKGVYLWGAQVEEGSFPSSYIPTTSAAVTRNADALTFPEGGNISPTAGAVLVEFTAPYISAHSNQAILGWNGTMPIYFDIEAPLKIFDSTMWVGVTTPPLLDVGNRGATRWSGSEKAACLNGGSIGTGVFDGTMGSGAVTIGGGFSGFGPYCIYAKYLLIFNCALTDAEMIAITS